MQRQNRKRYRCNEGAFLGSIVPEVGDPPGPGCIEITHNVLGDTVAVVTQQQGGDVDVLTDRCPTHMRCSGGSNCGNRSLGVVESLAGHGVQVTVGEQAKRISGIGAGGPVSPTPGNIGR